MLCREPEAAQHYDAHSTPPHDWLPGGDELAKGSRWDQAGRLIELQQEKFAEQRQKSKAPPPDREQRTS